MNGIKSHHNTSTAVEDKAFDYIICGGGTAGCTLAARLSSVPELSVLLVEAGRDSGLAPDVLVPGKYIYQLTADTEGLWELPTVPQKELNGRTITFLRGKQLGGSSAVNYMALARGPDADYDEWARLTGDDSWAWNEILPLMKELEDFHPEVPEGYEDFADPDPSLHGKGGPIAVGFGDVMTPGVTTFIGACQEVGIPICPDNNSGNPVGVGLAQFNVGNGQRSYAANAFLGDSARQSFANLEIMTNTACDKIEFDGPRAVGVHLTSIEDGSSAYVRCKQEVILTAGTFGTPHLLMLSGIGPRKTLEKYDIPVIADSLHCGQNMLDHSIVTCEYRVDSSLEDHNKLFLNPQMLSKAEEQYRKDRTGPLAIFGTSGSVAFPKLEKLFKCKEFDELDEATQAFMTEPTRPSGEIWLGSGPASFDGAQPHESYVAHEILLQNNLSRGNVTLRSRNPRDLPVIDPNFLQHPYDKRIAIETVRKAVEIAGSTPYKSVIERMVHGPGSELIPDATELDDATILAFVRANLGQGYHSLGTCKMGRYDDVTAVVDTEFRVRGVEGLRVADLSVCPILTCNHTQINVYLIAEKLARLLIEKEHDGQNGKKDET